MRNLIILFAIFLISSSFVFSQTKKENSETLYKKVEILKQKGEDDKIYDLLTESFKGTDKEELWKIYYARIKKEIYLSKDIDISCHTEGNALITFYGLFSRNSSGDLLAGIHIINGPQSFVGYLFSDQPFVVSESDGVEKHIDGFLFYALWKEYH